jgi:nicotinamidase-related amidase
MKIDLLVIDPQNDFVLDGAPLHVPGAKDDMFRLAAFVKNNKGKISDIHVTLDSHHLLHIAHPLFWKNKDNQHPSPFTVISYKDVESGKWEAADPGLQEYVLEYTANLNKNGRYVLCIWPPHCLIGSSGHSVVSELFNAFKEWEEQFDVVNFISKGSNIFTEHYSAIKADVPMQDDPSTQMNTRLIDALLKANKVLISGEASSHCVAFTARDIVEAFGDEKYLQKLVILEDTMSPVPGFENFQADFFKEMKAKNVEFSTTEKYFAKG